MITREEIDLARKAPWLDRPRVDDEGPENNALFLIGVKVEQYAHRGETDRAIDRVVEAYAPSGLDRHLAETAYGYVKCWG